VPKRASFNYNQTYRHRVKHLSFDLIPRQALTTLFQDGRNSHILETFLQCYFVGFAKSGANASFDLLKLQGLEKLEVKTATKNGVHICPSGMLGSQRTYNKTEHVKRLSQIDGVIIVDITKFPEISFRAIPSGDLIELVRKRSIRGFTANQVQRLMKQKHGQNITIISEV